MSNYLKPQSPLYHKKEDTYFYPLTTVDQVITTTGERLNSLFKKTIKETATLQAADWSDTLPYIQTITISESTDDYNVDANIVYSGNKADTELNKAASCLTYVKKSGKNIIFYCLKEKPEIDIPIEITGTCRNTIATVEEGVKLNFGIKRYDTEEELLADTPKENTIGIISDVEINGYRFSATEPEDMNEGEVWIKTGTKSDVVFDIIDGITVHPISVKQYITDAWVDVNVTAKSYQNGEWVEWWNGGLYDSGNQFDKITGGLKIVHTAATKVTFNDENFIFAETSENDGNGYNAAVYTNNKIDITNFKMLTVEVTDVSSISTSYSAWGVYVGLSNNNTSYNPIGNSHTITNKKHNTIGTAVISLDITNIEGFYYPVIYCDVTKCTVNKWYLS